MDHDAAETLVGSGVWRPERPDDRDLERPEALASERLDVLGEPFVARTIPLADDEEGPVVATLVRRTGRASTARRAVLYLHGFSDYFFQRELADFFTARGLGFYALDLRKCGRSLLPHQTPNNCRNLDDYHQELDAAARAILGDGHDSLVVVGHSTGGLIAPLWLAERTDLPVVGLVLNSPFFEFRQPPWLRVAMLPVVDRLAGRWPALALPKTVDTGYGQSLHASRHGEWDYRLDWKPLGGHKVRLGWLRAVNAGHRRLQAGLDLQVPALVLTSTRAVASRSFAPGLSEGDAVLDPDAIARWTPAVGRHVTGVRLAGAMHDVYLSRPAVRAAAYEVTGTWLDAWVG